MIIPGRLKRIGKTAWAVIDRTFDDGFVHAGNLAYLSLTTLFPMFVVIASIAGALGRGKYGERAFQGFMDAVPPDVGSLLAKPIGELIHNRAHGGLLSFGIIVALWSAAGFIETIRDIIRRAYGVAEGTSLWKRRLASTAGIIGAVILIIVAFAAQVVLAGASQFVARVIPFARDAERVIDLTRLLPPVLIFGALYVVFALLTPLKFRKCCPEWPGALLTTVVVVGATALMPPILSGVANYQVTYGSLAGVMISLLFFYVVGLGLVTGAHLNAVLAGAEATKDKEQRGVTPTKERE